MRISTVIRDNSCKNKNNKLWKKLKKVLFILIYLATQYYLRYILSTYTGPVFLIPLRLNHRL